jgi:glucose-6-phosphate 1-dehydrogenase
VQGEKTKRYRDEKNVPSDSTTETYVAVKLLLDSPRWRGTPVYLRTGKRLGARRTEIALHLKPNADGPFGADAPASLLLLEIDPEQGVRICFAAKRPGPAMNLRSVAASFRYGDYFDIQPSVGYETLLYDCMRGDPMLFQRADTIEAAWRVVQPLLEAWERGESTAIPYAAGGDGPHEADMLLRRDGRSWRSLDE